MDTSLSRFAAAIKHRRKALELTQIQLAMAAGVGRRFIIELESGAPGCRLEKVLRVTDALGLHFPEEPDVGVHG